MQRGRACGSIGYPDAFLRGLRERGAPRRAIVLAFPLILALLCACKAPPSWEVGKKYLHYPIPAPVGTFEPVQNSTAYANIAQSQVYETLLQYHYLKRPYELEPLLLESMPAVSDDRLTYTFTLKGGVRFHDDPCFTESGGRGRELVAQDVIWSLMRMADSRLAPTGWWLYKDRVAGFDAFQARMNARARGAPFDWNAHIEGLEVVDRYRFRIHLTRPFPQLLYILAMGYSAALPRECAEHYGEGFAAHPVGTGPFVLAEWVRGSRLRFERNPNYREARYPSQAAREYIARGLLKPKNRRVPFLDGIVLHVFEQSQPLWLKFRAGDLDVASVPFEYQDMVFNAAGRLRPSFVREGVGNENVPMLDFIYRGFNMEDAIVGRGERARKLRCAISLALDTAELNDAFYSNTAILYDGPIPPGLSGYEPGITSPYRGPQIDRAKELLGEAGYPGGRGLAPIQYHTSRGGSSVEMVEMTVRQLKKIGVRLDVQLSSFPELAEKLQRRKAPMFSLAWGADYPDAENFLQLFYGPNRSPGSNNFNYDNPAFNALYEQSSTMLPGSERAALYRQMRAMIIHDCPAIGSMARTRYFVWNARVHHVVPSEVGMQWLKYVDLEAR